MAKCVLLADHTIAAHLELHLYITYTAVVVVERDFIILQTNGSSGYLCIYLERW
jgi:hypothetical protein